MKVYVFAAGVKQIAIEAVLDALYSKYAAHSRTVIRSLITRNTSTVETPTGTYGFWYKQNTYAWDDDTSKHFINVPLCPSLHEEMEVLYQEERIINMEKQRINHWLVQTLNYCKNPVDVKMVIPEFIYGLMPESIKDNMEISSQSILNQSYNMRKNKREAERCSEAACLRIMTNSLLG